jgi:hypothetical protein
VTRWGLEGHAEIASPLSRRGTDYESEIPLETCSSCGAKLVEDAHYCHACGSPVEKRTWSQQFSVSSDDVASKVKELIHEGNVSRITVRDENGRALLEIPVTAGIVGVLIAPWLAAAGAIAAFATKCTIEVVRTSEASDPLRA